MQLNVISFTQKIFVFTIYDCQFVVLIVGFQKKKKSYK